MSFRDAAKPIKKYAISPELTYDSSGLNVSLGYVETSTFQMCVHVDLFSCSQDQSSLFLFLIESSAPTCKRHSKVILAILEFIHEACFILS